MTEIPLHAGLLEIRGQVAAFRTALACIGHVAGLTMPGTFDEALAAARVFYVGVVESMETEIPDIIRQNAHKNEPATVAALLALAGAIREESKAALVDTTQSEARAAVAGIVRDFARRPVR